MKRKSDPRHLTRTRAFKSLYSHIINPHSKITKTSLAGQITSNQKGIDKLVGQHAPAWPITQINPVDLTILRLAIFELLFKEKKEPYKVIIDEAVEIAKTFGNDTSSGFVNGVLGSIVKAEKLRA